jgi:D-inositol-3-phosphate glycosyltransferase
MKIAMVSEHASPLSALGGVDAGGQNVHVAELSAALIRRGHQVTVYTRRDDGALPERVHTDAGYEVVHVPAGPAETIPKDQLLPYMPAFGDFLAADWADDRPDVAHAHFWMSGIATQQAAQRHGIPAVQTFHALGVVKRRYQGADDTSPGDRLELEARVAREATWVAATCTDEVFELVRIGRDRSRITVVPCGVDVSTFSPVGAVMPRGSRHRIVTVGRFVPRKGFDDLIRALPAIADAELVIVGGPPDSDMATDRESARLRDLAARCGVADRVQFYGPVARADMPAILRSADVVACTPWYEPFGIVPLEAMACGIPVVASAVGGMLDTVVDGVTGRLVPPKSPRHTATAITAILQNPALRRSLGSAGRGRAKSRYSWDRVAADTQRTYARLVPAIRAKITAHEWSAGIML